MKLFIDSGLCNKSKEKVEDHLQATMQIGSVTTSLNLRQDLKD